MICFSVFIAVVRAFMAVSRVILSWRIISTAPSAVLGMAVDWPREQGPRRQVAGQANTLFPELGRQRILMLTRFT